MQFAFPDKFEIDRTARFANEADHRMFDDLRNTALAARKLSASDFERLARWKSPRLLHHVATNTDSEIEEITRVALTAATERCRISVLLGLAGVQWPMASVVLHVCHDEPYPILDVRALGALGVRAKPTYTFSFWMDYVRFCRKTAEDLAIDMRTLDRNLFVWSQANKVMAR